MTKPQIVFQDSNIAGYHNTNNSTMERLEKAATYKDLSAICIRPTRGEIHAKVVQSWECLMIPMNQKFYRITPMGLPVDDAYNFTIEAILNNPELSKWKYIITLEDDNIPPPDGVMKLLSSINEYPEYDAIGALYWTKGEAGQPMIYGNPHEFPLSMRPQMPIPETVQRCNGLGMGFTIFKMDLFRDKKIGKPWFKTQQEFIPNKGIVCYTQDLHFFEKAGREGHKFACDTRIRVGHYDKENDIVW